MCGHPTHVGHIEVQLRSNVIVPTSPLGLVWEGSAGSRQHTGGCLANLSPLGGDQHQGRGGLT